MRCSIFHLIPSRNITLGFEIQLRTTLGKGEACYSVKLERDVTIYDVGTHTQWSLNV